MPDTVSTPVLFFLSTLSLRRATRGLLHHMRQAKFFYPRSPCGERLHNICWHQRRQAFSIHALLAESDAGVWRDMDLEIKFSIHALLAESDYSGHLQSALLLVFYPRSPCGERPPGESGQRRLPDFSIHALLAESDSPRCGWFEVIHLFYPRSPCGERPNLLLREFTANYFLSTLSLRRATPQGCFCYLDNIVFYPRSPCGERRM